MKDSNRIIINTGILYLKMILTIGITLYSTRLILDALGASDYGIYNVVGGIVSALSFLQSAMTISTQRYMSFYQGSKNVEKQKEIFTSSIILHICLAIFLLLLLISLRSFAFSFLNIPNDRVEAAQVIYIFIACSVFCTIISVPFTATLNAHENMLYIAIVGVLQVLLVLLLSLSMKIVTTDKLIFYGFGILSTNVIILLFYCFYCFKKYPECKISNFHNFNLTLVKELTFYAGWNTFGALSGMCKINGLAVVINVFFGTIVNAAFGIAQQVSGLLNFFSSTLLKAVNPQIMKSEGTNDRERMLRLAFTTSKLGFFLIAVFAIPILFEISSVLQIWLSVVPENTTMFCSMIVISIMINQLTIGLQSAIQAIGKIKYYMIFVGGTKIMMIPTAFYLLKLGASLSLVMFVYVVFEFIAGLLRLFFLHIYGGISILDYIKRIIINIFPSVALTTLSGFIISSFLVFNYRFFITIPFLMCIFIFTVYVWGLSSHEKVVLRNLFFSIKNKFLSK